MGLKIKTINGFKALSKLEVCLGIFLCMIALATYPNVLSSILLILGFFCIRYGCIDAIRGKGKWD